MGIKILLERRLTHVVRNLITGTMVVQKGLLPSKSSYTNWTLDGTP